MRQIVYFLLTCALLVDLVQVVDFFGSADLRLWQIVIIAIFGVILMAGRMTLQKSHFVIFGLLFIHGLVASVVLGQVVVSALVQITLLFAVVITLRSSAHVLTGRDYINLYLLAAVIVALSIIAEAVIALAVPSLADATIYQILRKDPGPLGMARAHGLMMEPSEVSLILPPAIYVALLQSRRKLAATLILAAVLSFSGLTFIGLLAALVCFIWTVRGFRPLRVIAVLLVVGGASYMIEPLRARIQWVLIAPQYLAGYHVSAWELQKELSGTVGSLVIALRVMAVDLRDSWFLGTGLGNFGYGATQVVGAFSDTSVREISESTVLFVKASTGGGLAIRIIGELGIFGILALVMLIVALARMMQLTRKLCRQNPAMRLDWRIQAIGLMTVVMVPYLIRKDAYLDIYFLLPVMFGFLAAGTFPRAARRPMRMGHPRVPVRAGS